ncbi:MAG: hypothetical protein WC346_12730 [Methanogenium sp.]|jgi:predicted hydrocarbon binding protein
MAGRILMADTYEVLKAVKDQFDASLKEIYKTKELPLRIFTRYAFYALDDALKQGIAVANRQQIKKGE